MSESRHISAFDGEAEMLETEKPPIDLGDAATVNKDRKAKKTENDISRDTLRNMMLKPENRKWFFALLTKCHILQNPFSRDQLIMSFSCGEMNIGQQVFIEMNEACPELYALMMDENNPVRKTANAR